MATSGQQLEVLPPDQPYKFYVPIIADYFPIYHGNVDSLGLIKDDDLRYEIISGYNLAKSLVDTLRLNNEFLRERDRASDQAWIAGGAPAQNVLKIKEHNLAAYGPKVRQAHLVAKNSFISLNRRLESAIKKGSKESRS
jgi:hypothetical protein